MQDLPLSGAAISRFFFDTLRSLILQIDHTDHAILVVCERGCDFSAGLIAALLMCTGDPVEKERKEERGS